MRFTAPFLALTFILVWFAPPQAGQQAHGHAQSKQESAGSGPQAASEDSVTGAWQDNGEGVAPGEPEGIAPQAGQGLADSATAEEAAGRGPLHRAGLSAGSAAAALVLLQLLWSGRVKALDRVFGLSRTILWHRVLGVAAAGILILESALLARRFSMPQPPVAEVGTVEAVGIALFTDYLLAFEITSVLLLAAVIGAISLAKKKI